MMKRSRLVLVAAGTLGLAATLLTSGLTMTASAAPVSTQAVTQVTTFNPWTAAGKLAPGIKVSERLRATGCTYASSYDVGNRDAWRCFQASGAFYDPCFAPANRTHVTQVACITNPWAGKAIILTLAKPLAHSSWGTPRASATKYPWAMVLSNGQRCSVIGGTSKVVDGVGLYYGCPRGDASDPSTGTRPWTVRYEATGARKLTTVAVATAIR
jgi:hypothetical protein